MASSSTMSDLLGYASIGCWLGAQFPQLLENHRRRSVEGLAWPFLANWLAGDLSNLIGCILTHQLPFQTYLATYFCFVDITLVGQYIYYTATAEPPPPRPARLRSASSATITRRLSIERPPTHYRALSNVAANVAAAAALAAQQEEHTRWHAQHHRHGHDPNTVDLGDDDEVDEAVLARLADSFHSEGGRTASRKKVSFSRERGGSLGRNHIPSMSPITSTLPSLQTQTSPVIGETDEFAARGRSLSRQVPFVESPEDEWMTASTAQRRSSRASRKGAGMVFLGAWALFGVGTLAGSKRGLYESGRSQVGRVLQAEQDAVVPSLAHPGLPSSSLSGQGNEDSLHLSFDQLRFIDEIPAEDPHEDHGPSMDYIIGRISAWICATLYLTSRLPQIWKNYTRKSVEGLSMSLFVFAFLGNLLYVASILTSPKLGLPEPRGPAFLRESIPYLIGSGGTLMFDITIVTQSFLYRPKHLHRGRRPSLTANEEEQGLLSADTTGAAEDMTAPSRRRMAAPSEGGD